MKTVKMLYSGVSIVVFIMALVLDAKTLGAPTHGKVVMCYVETFATYLDAPYTYDIDDIEPSLCTHLVYVNAGLNSTAGEIRSFLPLHDLTLESYKRTVNLKKSHPHLKVTIRLGSSSEKPSDYAKIAATAESRGKYISSVLKFFKTHGFDGLVWDIPSRDDEGSIENTNFVLLVKELSEAFQPHNYTLAAVLDTTVYSDTELGELSRHLSLMIITSYEFYGTFLFTLTVRASAPLRGRDDDDKTSVEYKIKHALAHGVNPSKLLLGLPLFAKNFRLLNHEKEEEVVFARTETLSQGFEGPASTQKGYMWYHEICMETKNQSANWTRHWHDQSFTPYLRDETRVISFDDSRSIAAKVKMAIDNGLGGVMVRGIEMDDFKGVCGREEDSYIDFLDRYNKMADDPVIVDAWKSLQLPDTNEFYTTSNGTLHLVLPESNSTGPVILRAVNEATTLAVEEKRVDEEMDKILSNKLSAQFGIKV